MSDDNSREKTMIEVIKNASFKVSNLENFYNSKGEKIPVKPVLWLCRCGASGNKPYCDGTHKSNGFTDEKSPSRLEDQWKDYRGREITIHDNRSLCSHSGECVRGLSAVFDTQKRPWISPDAAPVDDIIKIIKKCPSGALSYTINGVRQSEFENEPTVRITKHGPLDVTGDIEFRDEHGGSHPASVTRYALCRCGASRNKPFCDGSHLEVKFRDEKN